MAHDRIAAQRFNEKADYMIGVHLCHLLTY
jgi:hypothetical protein